MIKRSILVVLMMMFIMMTACTNLDSAKKGYEVTDFSVGGIKMSDGTGEDTHNKARMKSGFWPLGRITVKWDADEQLEYFVIYFDKDYNFLSSSGVQSKSKEITSDGLEDVKYVRFVLKYTDGDRAFKSDFKLPKTIKIYSEEKNNTIKDEPDTNGVENVLARADLCTSLKYNTLNVLPGQKGDIGVGQEIQGIMYSSTRDESLYVPNAVSVYSYLSALNDPKSYIYSRSSDLKNSKTYYGSVCSSFVSFCYDLPCIYTTHQIGELDSFEFVEQQNIDSIQLGDIMLKKDTHVCVIVDIERDQNGKVVSITESESAPPQVRSVYYSRSSFIKKWFDNDYFIYRYKDLDNVSKIQTEKNTDSFNHNLCPRRGDKSNWPLGEPVEIDVLDIGSFSDVELYKDEKLLKKSAIPDDLTIVFEDLQSGSYKACLSNKKERSDFVYFMVVDTEISVESIGTGKAKISFHSQNADPVWFAWCIPNDKNSSVEEAQDLLRRGTKNTSRHYLAAERAFVLTDEDKQNGYVITEYLPGLWLFKVEFETEYGVVSSSFEVTEIA